MGEQGAKRQNDGWKGIGVTIAILAIATGIGAMFRYLRFTEANILIVYVLGVMITAVITASRMWSVLSSLCSVLLFNFLYTIFMVCLRAHVYRKSKNYYSQLVLLRFRT